MTGSKRSGGHSVLLAVYALLFVASGARSIVQLVDPPYPTHLPYVLSLLAAVTYALGWWAIRSAADGRTGFASVMLWVELAGVVAVGTLTIVRSDLFLDQTVWTWYGAYYLGTPAILPVAGLLWLRRKRHALPQN